MINQALAQFRLEKKYTMQSMSQTIGISKSFYSKIEEGYKNPSYDFIKKFVGVFPNADIRTLFFT